MEEVEALTFIGNRCEAGRVGREKVLRLDDFKLKSGVGRAESRQPAAAEGKGVRESCRRPEEQRRVEGVSGEIGWNGTDRHGSESLRDYFRGFNHGLR